MKHRNFTHYLIVLIIITILKLIYKYSEMDDLHFLLEPTSKIVGFLNNSSSIFIKDAGYYHESLNIIINKSCSGFNFLILCFAIHIFSIIPLLYTAQQRVYAFFILFVGSYFLTIVINSCRIVLIILLNKLLVAYGFSINWMHQAAGTFVYLFFLIVIYLTFNHLIARFAFIKSMKNDEKFA
ncbi:exosortase K [Apibacter raozihei]|uniref:exosortase K n=1 Tax=Apibacter raozihei TaxID=2500547 RepID=UPI001E5E6A3A|nr:exosortase K [Apibacter raozihei]